MSKIEELIGYTFKDKSLLDKALTHSSYANEHFIDSNERLEFLGDAVLELATSRHLYLNISEDEGVLTKTRAKAVCEEALNVYASKLNLGGFLKLGHGEEQTGGRTRPAIIADAFEALLGAVYLDSNIETIYAYFDKNILPYMNEVLKHNDYKSILQEKLQSDKRSIRYEIVSEIGPSNNPSFTAVVYMDDIILGRGIGRSKQKAEQEAAKEALKKEAKAKA